MNTHTRTSRNINDVLPELLRQRKLSLRALAAKVDVSHAHLSRALRGADHKCVSGELAARIANALGLPADYFPEYRERAVIEQLRHQPGLRDHLYDSLAQAAVAA